MRAGGSVTTTFWYNCSFIQTFCVFLSSAHRLLSAPFAPHHSWFLLFEVLISLLIPTIVPLEIRSQSSVALAIPMVVLTVVLLGGLFQPFRCRADSIAVTIAFSALSLPYVVAVKANNCHGIRGRRGDHPDRRGTCRGSFYCPKEALPPIPPK